MDEDKTTGGATMSAVELAEVPMPVSPRAVARACPLTPEPAAGPYRPAAELVRRSITEGRTGLPLALRIRVVDAVTGHDLPGAAVEVWHCNALGVYSGSTPDAADETFLRGVQFADEHGTVSFSTIFPGWYPGRAAHLHVCAYPAGGRARHTGEFFFADDLTRAVAGLAPYRSNRTSRTTTARDPRFRAAGPQALLAVVPRDRHRLATGLLGTLTVALEPDATAATVS